MRRKTSQIYEPSHFPFFFQSLYNPPNTALPLPSKPSLIACLNSSVVASNSAYRPGTNFSLTSPLIFISSWS